MYISAHASGMKWADIEAKANEGGHYDGQSLAMYAILKSFAFEFD